MILLDKLHDVDHLQSLFNHIQTGVCLIDDDFTVVMLNDIAMGMLNVQETDVGSFKCHQLFSSRLSVCEDCPLHSLADSGPQTRSYSLVDEEGGKRLLRVKFNNWRNYFILTINDVSREVSLLKKIDLNRKEAEAKNILFERRLQKMNDKADSFRDIIDHLPDALVTVNNDLEIQRFNSSATEVFGVTVTTAQKCYELLGLGEPCELCPAARGFALAHDFKKKHAVNGKFFTELIIKSPFDDGGMLFFSDSTKKIQLIEQIKQHQQTLADLVELEEKMQKEEDVELVLNHFLDKFLDYLAADTAALIVDEVRSSRIWMCLDRKIDKGLKSLIIKDYLSRKEMGAVSRLISKRHILWNDVLQLPLLGGHGRGVGLLIIRGAYSEEQLEKISLFLDPLGAYIHNKLLMKQLEEKANRDPLTELYNRGYLDRAVVEEEEKRVTYGINYALVVVDINALKRVNDVYGHSCGDQMIKLVADQLQESVREGDVVSRVGGDEFFILLADSTDDSAHRYISRLKNEVFDALCFELEGGDKLSITVSLGAAGSDCFSAAELLKKADARMYKDKEDFYEAEERYR